MTGIAELDRPTAPVLVDFLCLGVVTLAAFGAAAAFFGAGFIGLPIVMGAAAAVIVLEGVTSNFAFFGLDRGLAGFLAALLLPLLLAVDLLRFGLSTLNGTAEKEEQRTCHYNKTGVKTA